MWKTLIQSIREYKKPTILAPVYVTLEVIIECIIPFITALLVNQIKAVKTGSVKAEPFGMMRDVPKEEIIIERVTVA